jgi:Subtilase family
MGRFTHLCAWQRQAVAWTLASVFFYGCQTQSPRGRRREPVTDSKTGTGENVTPKNGPQGSSPSSNGSSVHTVMIIDDGFDPSHEVFKAKIVGEYTVSCDDDKVVVPESEFNTTPLEQVKVILRNRYKSPRNTCKVSEGIRFTRPAEFGRIEQFRAKWNDGIKQKIATLNSDAVQTVSRVLSTSGKFHGTNTSGLIAYQNPNVKLVLVQMELGDPNSPRVRALCPTQRGINNWVEAHKDSAVRKEFIEGPSENFETALDDVVKKHQVTLVNMSFGREPRPLRERSLAEAGCGQLDYRQFYQVTNELDRARDVFQKSQAPSKNQPLAIQAAGNDGIRVDSIADSFECSDPEGNLVVAGSLDLNGQRSRFTNFGRCVDYYLLGSRVIVAAPDNFLNVVNGTSFSSPLLARFISKEFSASESPDSIIKKLKTKADASGNLTKGAVPIELSYEDNKSSIGTYALTDLVEAPDRRYLPLHFRWGMGGFR